MAKSVFGINEAARELSGLEMGGCSGKGFARSSPTAMVRVANRIMKDEGNVKVGVIVLAFVALYVIWGSTYLAIKVAIETMPPLLMAMARFCLAGAVLYFVSRWRGVERPTLAQWKHALIVGGFLIAGGNGTVSYAEQFIDSSMAALIIASNPLAMTLIGWWGGVQTRPTPMAWLSLLGGFAGVAFLIVSDGGIEWDNSIFGYALVGLAVILWVSGSIFSKRNPMEQDPWMQSGMQMFCGGLVCLLVGALTGEFSQLDLAGVSGRSWVAFSYLVVMGSLVGFTSYVFLLRHCAPSTVSSHAYVNPAVALLLGWLILDEQLTLGGWLGSGLILVSVFVLLRQNAKTRRKQLSKLAKP